MKPVACALVLSLIAPAAMACETFNVGDITVTHAWSRATIGAGRPGVFYVEIRNGGAEDDALIGMSTPAAAKPTLHETVVQGGLASMPLAERVPIPAQATVTLAPSGFHGMLMDMTAALKEGESFPVTLSFEKAGEVTVNVDVLSMRAEGPECAEGQ